MCGNCGITWLALARALAKVTGLFCTLTFCTTCCPNCCTCCAASIWTFDLRIWTTALFVTTRFAVFAPTSLFEIEFRFKSPTLLAARFATRFAALVAEIEFAAMRLVKRVFTAFCAGSTFEKCTRDCPSPNVGTALPVPGSTCEMRQMASADMSQVLFGTGTTGIVAEELRFIRVGFWFFNGIVNVVCEGMLMFCEGFTTWRAGFTFCGLLTHTLTLFTFFKIVCGADDPDTTDSAVVGFASVFVDDPGTTGRVCFCFCVSRVSPLQTGGTIGTIFFSLTLVEFLREFLLEQDFTGRLVLFEDEDENEGEEQPSEAEEDLLL